MAEILDLGEQGRADELALHIQAELDDRSASLGDHKLKYRNFLAFMFRITKEFHCCGAGSDA